MGGTSMEMVIPQTLICHIYGENNNNIAHVQQVGRVRKLGTRIIVFWPL